MVMLFRVAAAAWAGARGQAGAAQREHRGPRMNGSRSHGGNVPAGQLPPSCRPTCGAMRTRPLQPLLQAPTWRGGRVEQVCLQLQRLELLKLLRQQAAGQQRGARSALVQLKAGRGLRGRGTQGWWGGTVQVLVRAFRAGGSGWRQQRQHAWEAAGRNQWRQQLLWHCAMSFSALPSVCLLHRPRTCFSNSSDSR